VDTKLIRSDPNAMMEKPVIAGTRITVESILERLAAGEFKEQILAAHPRLTPEGIQAALAFAAAVLHADAVYPTPDSAAQAKSGSSHRFPLSQIIPLSLPVVSRS
jgi:uncharacterized protein (DUF433 family)